MQRFQFRQSGQRPERLVAEIGVTVELQSSQFAIPGQAGEAFGGNTTTVTQIESGEAVAEIQQTGTDEPLNGDK